VPIRTAKRLKAGAMPRSETIDRMFAAPQPETARYCQCGCGSPLPPGRTDQRFLSDAHRKRTARSRSR
jgi:hypothetical protein